MRDKLIRILESVSEPYEGVDPDVGVDAILSELRCDHCRYWENNAFARDDKAQYCLNPKFPRVICTPRTAPDFFCALFEGLG